ncbi:hypothetical protein IHE55_30000 [Streptomyces pactum]|uniref:Uncharacterized protein n=1 Tax=Streptomyces pactum TaxID=68249 RepID=A0ABS0NU99_9ACTN|nr:hypothetical protein [Streptomyces pactum]MBH5338784.1 hypothetical protein [Streptomyces pactum]
MPEVLTTDSGTPDDDLYLAEAGLRYELMIDGWCADCPSSAAGAPSPP